MGVYRLFITFVHNRVLTSSKILFQSNVLLDAQFSANIKKMPSLFRLHDPAFDLFTLTTQHVLI